MERSFLENMPRPLFTQLRGETVWKFGIDPESGLRSGQEGSKKSRSAASWRQRRVLETPSAIFQTVSEGEFSEVRLRGILFSCLPLRRIVSAPVIRALSHTPPAAYPAMTSLK